MSGTRASRARAAKLRRPLVRSVVPAHAQARRRIVLATGGDMSNSAHGNFYVGIMVTGATDDATDDAVQVDIVAVVYKNIE